MTVARRWARQDEYNAMIALAAVRYGVPASLIKAVIATESGFDAEAVNHNDPGGAWGLMQMLPATAAGLGYTGPMSTLLTSPGLAIDLGTRLLAENLVRTSGSVADSVSAYNGGWNTKRSGGYTNQAYVNGVLALVEYFRAWDAQTGGVTGPTPVTFPAGAADSGGTVVDGTTPRMRFPWIGLGFGVGLWAVILLALKGC